MKPTSDYFPEEYLNDGIYYSIIIDQTDDERWVIYLYSLDTWGKHLSSEFGG